MDNRTDDDKTGMIVIGIAKRMRDARVAAHIVQDVAAKRCEVSPSSYKSYEAGQRVPTVSFLVRFAGEMGVDPSWLILGDTGGALAARGALVESVALTVARAATCEVGEPADPERLARISRYAYETSVAKGTDFAVEFHRIMELSGAR